MDIHLAGFTVTSRISGTRSRSAVYRGYRDSDNLPVVIKTLAVEHPAREDLAQLRHEYAILLDLKLAETARPLGLEKLQNGLALILEEITGQSLHDLLATRRLTVLQSLTIAKSVADSLAKIHSASIVHRDINPQNIITELGTQRTYVIDFGIAARLVHTQEQAGAVSAMVGTLAYIAPEQTGRMSRTVDERADLYSLGVTLYEMLVGALPFTATDATEMIYSHIARAPIPPCEANPEISKVLSDIVMKLLAKNAEERYQSARGLSIDLQECIRQLKAKNTIQPFPIGAQDRSEKFHIPQHLYGREDELKTILESCTRAFAGEKSFVTIAGYSGVGKSSLVNELQRSIAQQQAFFIQGKFEQYSHGVPYSAFVEALGELLGYILQESPAAVAEWRQKFLAALGQQGRILTELLPPLERLIGPQPPVQQLPPTEAQNRFNLMVQRFLDVFAEQKRPIVMFLDDLQWGDVASLSMLQTLLTDPEGGYLLVIGAYRDNEVDASHRLSRAIADIKQQGVPAAEIVLRPLKLEHVTRMLMDMFGSGPEKIEPLARIAFEKTLGNPFFISQMLRDLHAENAIWLDGAQGTWQWDLQELEKKHVTDNVVDYMAGKLRRLKKPTQDILKVAACIGFEFDLLTVAALQDESLVQCGRNLWDAVEGGLITPADRESRFLDDLRTQQCPELPGDESVSVKFFFLHHRVQQAAYELLTDSERCALHLRIGRMLLAATSSDQQGRALFDIVNHFNIGQSLITEPQERLRVAELNLAAGRTAKSSAAYTAAGSYYLNGTQMLGEASWESNHGLCFALHSELIESDCLTGKFASAEQLCQLLSNHIQDLPERARLCELRIMLYVLQGRGQDAIRSVSSDLALFGIVLPEDEAQQKAVLDAEFAQASVLLGGRDISALLNLPEMKDPLYSLGVNLLNLLAAAAYLCNETLYGIVILKMVTLSLAHGNVGPSAFGYANYGFILSGLLGQFSDGMAFGRLAIDLSEKFQASELACRLNVVVGLYQHYSQPLREALTYFERAQRVGLDTGDFTFVSYACAHYVETRLNIGDDLSSIAGSIDQYLLLMQRTHDSLATALLRLLSQVVACLRGLTSSCVSFNSKDFDEDAFLRSMEEGLLEPIVFRYFTFKAQLYFLNGDYQQALDSCTKAERTMASSMGAVEICDVLQYKCMALLMLASNAEQAERERILKEVGGPCQQISTWAASCPDNYLHRSLLLDAERARVEGRPEEAMALYERAIAQAEKVEYPQHIALANNLAASFHASQGRRAAARGYRLEADYWYNRYGARGISNSLQSRFQLGGLVESGSTILTTQQGSLDLTRTSTQRMSSHVLDYTGVMEATQAISSEIVLDKALAQVMRILLGISGAQRAVLILDRDGQWIIEALTSSEPAELRLDCNQPLEASNELATSVVRYTLHTHETVILGNAVREQRFRSDPYIVSQSPKSIFCLALTNRARLIGAMYLENNLTYDAFTEERTGLLKTLSVQVAITLENALLYTNIRAATEKLKHANETLEQQVAKRTQELQKALAELWSEMDLARKIQTVLQPVNVKVDGYDVAAVSNPATEVGGDYFDVFKSDTTDIVVIGDVSGHGVKAGLCSMMVQSAVRSAVVAIQRCNAKLSPSNILGLANLGIYDCIKKIGKNQYMTATALCIDGPRVRFAGLHLDILIYRAATSTVEAIETDGVWIGIMEDITELLDEASFEMNQGDIMLLYTDGLTEAKKDGVMLETDGLIAKFLEVSKTTATSTSVVHGITAMLQSYKTNDDVTVIALKRI